MPEKPKQTTHQGCGHESYGEALLILAPLLVLLVLALFIHLLPG